MSVDHSRLSHRGRHVWSFSTVTCHCEYDWGVCLPCGKNYPPQFVPSTKTEFVLPGGEASASLGRPSPFFHLSMRLLLGVLGSTVNRAPRELTAPVMNVDQIIAL